MAHYNADIHYSHEDFKESNQHVLTGAPSAPALSSSRSPTPVATSAHVPEEIVQLLEDSLSAGGEGDLAGILERIYDATPHLDFWDDPGGESKLSNLLKSKYKHFVRPYQWVKP